MENKPKILIVEDEETLSEVLRFNLDAEGFEVAVAGSAEEALTLPLADFNLILLDIMMGEISGLKLAEMLKDEETTARIPIIFCTAKDSDDDMVSGLNLGADDYITKPYSIRNVVARVRSVLRRSGPRPQSRGELKYKGLEIDPDRKVCRVDGTETKMPRKEFEILRTLLSNPGRVFSREELLKTIWPDDVVVLDRVVDVNITRLRSKLGPYGKNIVTRSGYGYLFQD